MLALNSIKVKNLLIKFIADISKFVNIDRNNEKNEKNKIFFVFFQQLSVFTIVQSQHTVLLISTGTPLIKSTVLIRTKIMLTHINKFHTIFVFFIHHFCAATTILGCYRCKAENVQNKQLLNIL